MSISAKLVMKLRAKTNAGMMDCKKALIECDGDLEQAVQYLREKGIMKAAKKADRVAAEGLIFDAVSTDQKVGTLIEINSETDFVAKNEAFQNFGNQIAAYLLEHDVKDIEELYQSNIDGVTIKEKHPPFPKRSLGWICKHLYSFGRKNWCNCQFPRFSN